MKPGIKTTEWWLSLVAVLASLVLGSGLIVAGSTLEGVVTFIAGVLTSMGYTVSRGLAKKGTAHDVIKFPPSEG